MEGGRIIGRLICVFAGVTCALLAMPGLWVTGLIAKSWRDEQHAGSSYSYLHFDSYTFGIEGLSTGPMSRVQVLAAIGIPTLILLVISAWAFVMATRSSTE